tara:strand:- start:2375 stop:2587 length:213 start_codon:yes stop_codon:yes gene_type:complete
MIVTEVQLRVLKALDSEGDDYDPDHRPRNSLERLKKKGLVHGDKKSGWYLTSSGRSYLRVQKIISKHNIK